MKATTRRLQLATLLLISLSLGGCIILPHGHRHHGDGHRDRGRYANERSVIVLPAPQERDHGRWNGRRY